MKPRVNIAAGISAALLLSFSALAQQPPQKQPQRPGDRSGQMMSMDDMMKGCREHCDATSKSIDETLATIREAKQSNDPAKMRAALDKVEKPIAGMQEHMKMCRHMMDMMKMHGGMGGQKPEKRPPQ